MEKKNSYIVRCVSDQGRWRGGRFYTNKFHLVDLTESEFLQVADDPRLEYADYSDPEGFDWKSIGLDGDPIKGTEESVPFSKNRSPLQSLLSSEPEEEDDDEERISEGLQAVLDNQDSEPPDNDELNLDEIL